MLHPLVLLQTLFRCCFIVTMVTGKCAEQERSVLGDTPLCHLTLAPHSSCKVVLLHYYHKLDQLLLKQITLHLLRGWTLGKEKKTKPHRLVMVVFVGK